MASARSAPHRRRPRTPGSARKAGPSDPSLARATPDGAAAPSIPGCALLGPVVTLAMLSSPRMLVGMPGGPEHRRGELSVEQPGGRHQGEHRRRAPGRDARQHFTEIRAASSTKPVGTGPAGGVVQRRATRVPTTACTTSLPGAIGVVGLNCAIANMLSANRDGPCARRARIRGHAVVHTPEAGPARSACHAQPIRLVRHRRPRALGRGHHQHAVRRPGGRHQRGCERERDGAPSVAMVAHECVTRVVRVARHWRGGRGLERRPTAIGDGRRAGS